MDNIKIYTDGGCKGNGKLENKGAYAAILLFEKNDTLYKKIIYQYEEQTTNNIMELKGILRALENIKYPCCIDLYSDSQYAIDCLSKWIAKWEKNNWRTANKKPVKNKELLAKIYDLSKQHKINYHHVAGHSGVAYNEECDKLVNYAMDYKIDIEEIKDEKINLNFKKVASM